MDSGLPDFSEVMALTMMREKLAQSRLSSIPHLLPKIGPKQTAWGSENGRLKNAAPNCRTGKRWKRHVWKAKWCTLQS